MLNNIIAFSIKNKLIVGLFVLALIVFGIFELKKLPIDAVPDITNNQVQVITNAPALGATDVERLITFPIEQVSNNLPGLIEIRSFSRFGLSVVTIIFDDKTDIYWARQQVAERLQQVMDQIPKGIEKPTLAPVTTGLGEIYQYTVRTKKGYEDKYNAMELRTIQDWIVRRQLLGVKGVAEVSSFGGLLKQYEVAVEIEKLVANNVTIEEVYNALESNNENTGGSYIEKGPTILYIRSEGLASSIEDIQNTVIKKLPNGVPILIRDIGEVKFGNAPRNGALTYNGKQQVSGAVVMMLKGANSNEVINSIKERIAQIEKTLPEGVVIDPYLDRSKMVNNAISTVTKNLLEGALIVIFVLVLFIGNIRAGLLVASVIPLSMLFAIIMMNLFGVSGNLMSLGALDFGLIVDGSVIVVEAVLHKMSSSNRLNHSIQFSQLEMDLQVQSSASKMMNSAVFGQVIILVVYLPIFSFQGIEGKMFIPMAQTVAFALLGAFILSLTYIPMMSTLILSKTKKTKQSFSDKMMSFIEAKYQKGLVFTIRYQKSILLSIFALFLFALFTATKLGGEFIPELPEGDFAVETRVLPGSNLNTSIEAASKASKIILEKFPEVEQVVAKTGNSEVPVDPMPVDLTDMIVILKKRNEWTSASTYEELEKKMAKELEAVPGVTFGFQFPVAMRFNELISGARQDVVCKIFGENLDTLAYYAHKIGKIVNKVDGSEALYVEKVTGLPQIVVSYNRAVIAQYGLSIREINSVLNSAFAGGYAGEVFEGEKRFDLVVRLSGNKRKNLEDVQKLLINTPSGAQIPLNSLAKVEIIEGPNQIQRENSQRRITVGFNVRDRDVQSTVHDLQQKIENEIKLPAGYFISYGGAFENLVDAKERLYIVVPIALSLIFILLFFAFGSVKQSLLIYTSIPLSAIGGIFALYVRDISFSVSAGIGFIALFGVVVLNGIVLVAEFNRLRKEGMNNLLKVVIVGTTTRLRPVLMTAFVASLGFLPMALSHGEGAEVQRPLASVVIGGLLGATFLTLFILPMLYMFAYRKHKIDTKILTLLIVGLLFSTPNTFAQSTISLPQAIDTALANNLSVKNERLLSEYKQKLIKSGIDVPNTTVFGEYGQINSYYSDTRLGFSQTINFPTVYARQKSVFNEEWKSSVLNIGVKEAQLKMLVSQLYVELIFLQQKKELLLANDSIYSIFLIRANQRYQSGENNALEKATAENMRNQIAIQLKQILQDIELLQLQFQLVLNTSVSFQPDVHTNFFNSVHIMDSSSLLAHPILEFYKQQEQSAQAVLKLERSRLLPDLVFGYNIMGMKGTGSDNNVYNRDLRFQSVQVGLDIPIFNGGTKARINAAKTAKLIALNSMEQEQKKFMSAYTSASMKYQSNQDIVNLFESSALKNAMLIANSAYDQFEKGEINYMELTLLMNQSIQIKSDYIQAVKARNLADIELNYYLNK